MDSIGSAAFSMLMMMMRLSWRRLYFFFTGGVKNPRFTQFWTVYGSSPVI